VAAPDATAGVARVDLTLYGPACRVYAWALGALGEALRRGVGKARGRWRVAEVYRVGPDRGCQPIAGYDLAGLPPTLVPDLVHPSVSRDPCRGAVAVDLISPARLLRDGRLLPGREPVPFDLLVARILDRFAGLYGEGASDLLRPEVRGPLEAEAARVPLLEDHTRWQEVHDYSARWRAELLLGGKVGRAVYGEGAARFLPLLRAGEILQVGKNAASGCGRIEVGLLGG
jgi:hypothetical protein